MLSVSMSDLQVDGVSLEDPWVQVERLRKEHSKMLEAERAKLAETHQSMGGSESLEDRAKKLAEQAEEEKKAIMEKFRRMEEEERERREREEQKRREEEQRKEADRQMRARVM